MTEEQKQVMNNIKSHFNLMKERQEKNSAENTVNCNVINLHLEKNINYYKKKGKKNESAKIFKNNLSEIGMKLSPAFGRTAYNFFIRNKMGDSYENIKIRLSKKNYLKEGLNAAFQLKIKFISMINEIGIFFLNIYNIIYILYIFINKSDIIFLDE